NDSGIHCRHLGYAYRKVCHVQRTCNTVQRSHCNEEECGTNEIQHHIVNSCPGAPFAAAEHQKAVRGDEQDLEEHEQVEQVARKKGAVHSGKLQLQKRVEEAPPGVTTAYRIQHGRECNDIGEQHHERAQAVYNQHDAE